MSKKVIVFQGDRLAEETVHAMKCFTASLYRLFLQFFSGIALSPMEQH
jgi:hypothetical protein